MSYEFIEGGTEKCIHADYLQLVVVAPIWQGKILLIHRQSEPFTGMHSIPGGHKEKDESYKEAAKRELKEESGIAAANLTPFLIFIDHEHKIECHGFKFVSKNGMFSSPPNEEQEVIGWQNVTDALKFRLTPGLHESLQRLSIANR